MKTLSQHLKARFGQRVQKISLIAQSTCPNRDGTITRGGCTFCNNYAFFPNELLKQPIAKQLTDGIARYKERGKANKFLAYFQAYTSTHGDLDALLAMFQQAMAHPDVVGLCLGTRPDCLPEPLLQWLSDKQQRGYEIWLELGVQTMHDQTLARVNRGHTSASTIEAMQRCRAYGLQTCVHMIAGLPGETVADVLSSWRRMRTLKPTGVKWHPLQVIKGTQLAKTYRQGNYQPWSEQTYIATIARVLQETDEHTVVHRLSASLNKNDWLLAPQWSLASRQVRHQIVSQLEARQ
ncbi:TIGR01212 family radical SAM protein [Salinibius halmophilus]|uniref:TIGR01212 family radical SAM protein n=1 Tax=Salinibius halmophilus TaxID=1853216 RepID=UPI000E670141|nr:TIGR01212 family radical SAM protein [Salinibius halmophilus]